MISVIVPIYNAEDFLGRCIESILNQTYKDYELILINDGSTDNSKNICESIISKNPDKRIILINKENGGSASARNVGLRRAIGDFISFVDADDYVSESFLERMMDLQHDFNADVVQCNHETGSNTQFIFDDMDKGHYCISREEAFDRFCYRKTYLSAVVLWNKLIKKELFNNLTFVEGKSIDDEYICLELLKRCTVFVLSNERLYYYFQSQNSQMRSRYSIKKAKDFYELYLYQNKIIKNNVNKDYLGAYYYRCCRGFLDNLYYTKKVNPNNSIFIDDLKKEIKRSIKFVFISKKVTLSEKMLIFLQCLVPGMIWRIKRGRI